MTVTTDANSLTDFLRAATIADTSLPPLKLTFGALLG